MPRPHGDYVAASGHGHSLGRDSLEIAIACVLGCSTTITTMARVHKRCHGAVRISGAGQAPPFATHRGAPWRSCRMPCTSPMRAAETPVTCSHSSSKRSTSPVEGGPMGEVHVTRWKPAAPCPTRTTTVLTFIQPTQHVCRHLVTCGPLLAHDLRCQCSRVCQPRACPQAAARLGQAAIYLTFLALLPMARSRPILHAPVVEFAYFCDVSRTVCPPACRATDVSSNCSVCGAPAPTFTDWYTRVR